MLNHGHSWQKSAIFIAGLLTLLYLIDFEKIGLNTSDKERNTPDFKHKFFSKCECRRNESFILSNSNLNKISNKSQTKENEISKEESGLYEFDSSLKNVNYIVKERELNDLVCGVYETLRRGRHQKVIGYSLYGKENSYTGSLKSKNTNKPSKSIFIY